MKLEYLFVRKKDGFCSNEEKMKSLLKTNDDISFSGNSIVFKSEEMKYDIKCSDIKQYNELLFHFGVETRNNKPVELLENFDDTISNLLKVNGFTVYSLWDDVSSYYAKKLFPEMSTVENKARNIIYQLMTKTCGTHWLKGFLPLRFKERMNKEKEKHEFDDRNLFANLDFIDISTFLFTRYRLSEDIDRILSLVKNGTTSSTNVEDILKNYENKSNWERFFKDISNVDSLDKEWNDLYEYRNMVAHNRKIVKLDYEGAQGLLTIINDAFDEINKKINDIVIPTDEVEPLKNVYSGLFEFSDIVKRVFDTIKPIDDLWLNNAEEWKKIIGPLNDSLKPISALSELNKSYWAEYFAKMANSFKLSDYLKISKDDKNDDDKS